MAHGGKRPNSGRKKGPATIEREKLKDYIAKRVAENGEAIVSMLLEKSLKGDIMAVRELFDRGFGKAAQAIDMTSKGEQIGNTDPQAIKEAALLYANAIKQRKVS